MLVHPAEIRYTFPRSIRLLLSIQGLMNASHFMTVPLLAWHMSMTLHFSAASVATVMSANLLSAQVLPLFAGAIADRFGSQRVMALGLWLRGLGFLAFGLTDKSSAWVCFAFVIGAGVACYETGLYGVLGRQPKGSLAALFASNNQMLNVGAAIGPIVGGLASMADGRYAFAASALVFGLLGIAVFRLRMETFAPTVRRPMLSTLRSAIGNRDLWRLVVAASPWFFLFPQLYVAFPLYASRLAGPHAASAVYVVNGVIGLSFMFFAKRWLIQNSPFTSILYAYVAAAIAFTLVPAFDGIAWFLLFIIGYTMIETTMLPALETMTASLASEGGEATVFGVLSAIGALGGTAGYYTGSWLIFNATSVETWAIFGSVGALGAIVSALILPPLSPQISRE